MADQKQPARGKPSWRGTDGGGKSSTASARKNAASKRRQLLTALFLLLALGGATLAWLFLMRQAPEPFFLPLCITEYKDRHLPANSQAEQDRVAFVNGNYFSADKASNLFASQERSLVVKELDNLRNRKADEAVVLYVSGHAWSDAKGNLVLVPGDASPDNPASWLLFGDLLERWQECPARNKLLVLDVMRPIADARLGVLADDVAARVQADLKKLAESTGKQDLLVLCACAPGQTALTSEDLGRSVFGYYLDEGLRGWADGYNPEGKSDARVSVQELARFVRVRVDRWATRNRNARQTPVLVGTGDFELVTLEHGTARPAPELAPAAEYPAWLSQAWQLRDQWWADQTFRLAPRAFRQLEATALRAERQWRGGVDPGKIQNEFKKDLDDLKKQADAARSSVPRMEPRTLAQAAAQGKKPDAKTIEELKKLLEKMETFGQNLKPEEATAARLKLKEEFVAKLKSKPAVELAGCVFDAAVDDTRPRPERIAFLYGLLSKEQPIPLFVETLFLRRLDDLASRLPKENWPTETVRRSLLAVREGEKASACEPRALPWVRVLLDDAAQKRHDAEVLLFNPGFASAELAAQTFQEAFVEYQTVNTYLDTLREAYRNYDEALALLPGLTAYLVELPENDVRTEADWKEAVLTLENLGALLGQAPADGSAVPAAEVRKKIDDLQQKSDSLRALLRPLTKPVTDDLPALLAQTKRFDAGPAQILDIERSLEAVCLSAKERQGLWSAAREVSHRLQEMTGELDNADPEKERLLKPVDYDSKLAERREEQRAARRARMALDLFKLSGVTGLDPLESALPQAVRGLASRAALAQALRRVWAEQLPKQLQEAPDLRARDLLSRALDPFDLLDLDAQPRAQLHKQQVLAQWKWLGERYRYERQDLQGLADRPSTVEVVFYDDAAREYLKDAGGEAGPAAVHILGSPETPNLREGNREVNYPLKLETPATSRSAPTLSVLTADGDWLRVVAPEQPTREGTGPYEAPLTIELRPGAETSSTPPPSGFLVAARLDGRNFHHKVITLLPGSIAKQPRILVDNQPKETAVTPGDALGDLKLRPNTRQPIYLFVKNPGDHPKKMAIELKAEGHPADGAKSEPVEAGPGEIKRVSFGKTGADKPAELPEIKGPLQLRLLDLDNKNAVLDKKQLAVATGAPREYVQIVQGPLYKPAEKRLTVKLKARGTIAGPPCHVKLVLPRDRIPGLLKHEGGTFEGDVPAGGGELELTVDGLQLMPNRLDDNGFVYLTVDNYERAFIFYTSFPNERTPNAASEYFAKEPAVRMEVAPWNRADASLRLRLEVDHAPSGASLEVAMDRTNNPSNPEYVRAALLPGDRKQRIGFVAPGPEGGLLFENRIEDWSLAVDTRGISGKRTLRARVLDKNRKERSKVDREIVFDDSAPENVRIVKVGDKELPAREDAAPPVAVLRAPLFAVRAEGSDRESGIHDVFFFWGRPVDGKLPPNTQPVRASAAAAEDKPQQWSTLLPVPPDKRGITDLSVQFVNGVGQNAFETVMIEIAEPPPPGTATKGPGKIEGQVIEGRLPQKGLEVFLMDEKGMMVKAKKTTAEGGAFVFEDVSPGTYKVLCVKSASQTKGTVEVVVEAGKTNTIKIELFR